jgi:hypothetical protein
MTDSVRVGLKRMYLLAMREAATRGDRRIGTDHLLLGVLGSSGSRAAAALGVTVTQARDACSHLDQGALASIGLDVDLPRQTPASTRTGRLPLTPAARQVLSDARHEAHALRVQPDHVALALLMLRSPDPAAQVLDVLGIDRVHVAFELRAA